MDVVKYIIIILFTTYIITYYLHLQLFTVGPITTMYSKYYSLFRAFVLLLLSFILRKASISFWNNGILLVLLRGNWSAKGIQPEIKTLQTTLIVYYLKDKLLNMNSTGGNPLSTAA